MCEKVKPFFCRHGESFQEALHLSPSSEFGQFTLAVFDTLWCELALRNGEGRDTRRGPERKAAPLEVRSAALEWGTAHPRGNGPRRKTSALGECASAPNGFGSQIHVSFVKSSRGDRWARARVVYCRTLRSTIHALGPEFYATAYRYNLTFRCINCGRYEASANFRDTATGLRARNKSKHGYIQLGVRDVAGKAKPAAVPSLESCAIRAERHTALMTTLRNYGPISASIF